MVQCISHVILCTEKNCMGFNYVIRIGQYNSMQKKRCLTRGAWYEVKTVINNCEPLFRRRQAMAIFCRVFGEARKRFAREIRGFALVEERLSFYIRAGGRVAVTRHHAVVEANILGPFQSVPREIRARLGRPVLVAGAGRRAAGRGRRGGLGGSGCGG
jgi:hypothetical protein